MFEEAPDTAALVRSAHSRHGTEECGFHRGLVTARREPLTHTVLRALHAAVRCSFGDIPPEEVFGANRFLTQALADAEASVGDPRRAGPSPVALLETARCLASERPLLLVIDEFGKNLEALADGVATTSADPYLLQQLAEAAGGRSLPIFVVTLQHQSLDDYLASVHSTRRREWVKVRGRFEEIAYVESAAQTRALIGSVFEVTDERLGSRILRWAQPQARAMQSLGVEDLSNAEAVASCWPLRPIAAVVLSELCRRYGQHERTLFSFLTDRDVTRGFLSAEQPVNGEPVPALGLDAVYDYFVGAGNLVPETTASNSRWTEILTRIRDAHGLSEQQSRVVKAVAMLNLVSTSGAIRASTQVIELAEPGSATALKGLEDSGLVTFRSFADEYRIWQGTDVDIRLLLEQARQQIKTLAMLEVLASMPSPPPVVASRHSAQNHCLRVFVKRFASCNDEADLLDVFSPYDGQILLVVDGDVAPAVTPAHGSKPTLAAVADPSDREALDATAREVAALQRVLEAEAVKSDWVARYEMSERLAVAKSAFDRAVFAAFSSGRCRWWLLDGDHETELRAGRGSSVLSDASDLAYPHTPVVPNEMINRAHLTAQGAKARRLLIEAMIERPTEPLLGLEGNGPEVAVYKAILLRAGLHVTDGATGESGLSPPNPGLPDASLGPTWRALEAEFERAKDSRVNLNDVSAVLMSPPIGMKPGVVPVVVVAGLLVHREEIAVYEHGTFKPQLTVDLAERMVKNPGFFEIKHFASSQGARDQVVSTLAEQLGINAARPPVGPQGVGTLRVGNVLGVVSNLVSRVRRLDNYTLRTRSLSGDELTVRDAVLNAVEPDGLLFGSLPDAMGLPQVPVDDSEYPQCRVFASRVAATIEVLENVQNRLLGEALDLLVSSSGASSWREVVERANAVDPCALDSTIRPFVLALSNTGVDDEFGWARTIATVVSEKSPAEWSDEDARHFRRVLPERMASFERLLALYGDPVDIERRVSPNGALRAGAGDNPSMTTALRVVVTRSDGCEHARMVTVAADRRDLASGALDEVVDRVGAEVGSREEARNLLLALLGEQIMGGS